MNALRYNLIIYDFKGLLTFIESMYCSKGKNISQVKYAYILHDKDIDEDTGELKKEHYHLWLEFRASIKDRDLIPLLEFSGLNGNAISHQKTDRNFLAYLTHSTSASEGIKACYSFDDIHTNIDLDVFKDMYKKAVENVNKPSRHQQKIEESKAFTREILDIVGQNCDIINYLSLTRYLLDYENDELLEYYQKRIYYFKQILPGLFRENRIKKFSTTLDTEDTIKIENKGDFNDEEIDD